MTIYYTATDRTPFTYLIGWSKYKKYYYGRRTAKNCHPSELWKSYFTSSNQVKKFREIYGEPDIIEIRKIFSCIEKCCLWEDKVLARLDVKHNQKWLNLSGKYAFYGVTRPWNLGIPHSMDTKNKIGAKNSGKKYSPETNARKASHGSKNGMYGVKRYGKESPHYDKPHSESTKQLLSNIATENRKIKVICPHCNKTGDKQNFSRWHFDNCKLSPNYQLKTTWGRVCRLSDKKEMDPGNWAIYMRSIIHSSEAKHYLQP